MTKPTTSPEWPCTDPGSEVTDPDALKNTGWATGDLPAAGHFNWLFQKVGAWTNWLRDYAAGLELDNTFVGDNSFNGHVVTNKILYTNGQSGDTNPAQVFQSGVNTFKLCQQFVPQASNPHNEGTHVYMDTVGQIWRTHNCYFNGSVWMTIYDYVGWYWAEVFGTDGHQIYGYYHHTEPNWSTGSWTCISKQQDGAVSFVATSANSNPASSTAVSNKICALNTPKAWGLISLYGTGPTLLDGFNIASVAYGTVNGITNAALNITMASSLDNTNMVIFALFDGQDYCIPRVITGTPLTVNSCMLRLNNTTEDQIAWPMGPVEARVQFLVFGRQTT